MSAPAIFRLPTPENEPVRSYAPGSQERDELRARLDAMQRERLDVPSVIGGEEVRTGDTFEAVMPHAKGHVLADVHKAGAGATIDVSLGGRSGSLYGEPITATAKVIALSDGKFKASSPMMSGMPFELGPSCRLEIDGIDVIVTSRRSQVFDQEIFLLHGIDVTTYKIVALKSSQHVRAGFVPIAAEIIRADTPGATTIDLHAIPYARLEGEYWPLQADLTWSATGAVS